MWFASLSYCWNLQVRIAALSINTNSPQSLSACTPLYKHTQSLFNANGAEEYPVNVDTPLPAMSVLESKRGKWEIHYSHFQPKGIICTRHFSYLWRMRKAVHCTECCCFTFCRTFSSVCLLAYWKFSCEDYRNSGRPHKTNELLVDWETEQQVRGRIRFNCGLSHCGGTLWENCVPDSVWKPVGNTLHIIPTL